MAQLYTCVEIAERLQGRSNCHMGRIWKKISGI